MGGVAIIRRELLTPHEAARYLRLNTRTIVRLAREGKVPATKVGNRWRFQPERLDAWIENRHRAIPLVAAPLASLRSERLSVASLMRPEAVFLDMMATGRAGALSEIASRLAAAGALEQPQRFLELLLEREELMSTALFDGVAVPHPRRSAPGMFAESTVAVAISRDGVDFAGKNEAPEL